MAWRFLKAGRGMLAQVALALLVSVIPVGALRADPARISDLLHTGELFDVLQQEGLAYGDDLMQEIMGAPGDALWEREVSDIHDPAALRPHYDALLAEGLAQADQPAIEAWLASDLAQRMIGLEISARRALLDPSVEDAALWAAEEADAKGDPRLAAVRGIIEAGDLIEPNVMGGLNANLSFYRAMAEGGAFPYEVTETDMLADVAAQEPEIRADVTHWIEGYLFMAYSPLSLEEMTQIAEFSASKPGQDLMRAQFEAFDVVYEESSAALGAALARRLIGQEL
ncbi:DUF2059 domain-containing protein [Sedimentimonas flavescens]|uniref:DUF2059 domain-containing protein n=1 Tax=Sedimentimonas flavescens TaxID=2851012 RepID=UPI001C4A5020|nr:DUF2059 domain-containing protein [Sedimentimonas flavescens]